MLNACEGRAIKFEHRGLEWSREDSGGAINNIYPPSIFHIDWFQSSASRHDDKRPVVDFEGCILPPPLLPREEHRTLDARIPPSSSAPRLEFKKCIWDTYKHTYLQCIRFNVLSDVLMTKLSPPRRRPDKRAGWVAARLAALSQLKNHVRTDGSMGTATSSPI